jgi:kinesin family protein 3/17
MTSKAAEAVKVIIRCRPMSSGEQQKGLENVVHIRNDRNEITVNKPASNEEPKTFTFDCVFDINVTQDEIYQKTAAPIVENVLEGYNGTVFAYGQTGTGKTHTMTGVQGNHDERGVIPRSFESVFESISTDSVKTQFLVRASYLEIYNEQIRDLLSQNPKNKLDLHEKPDSGVYVKDLSYFAVKNVDQINDVMNIGYQNRTVGSTNMNEHSSRSHSVFTISIERCELGADGKNHIRAGKLNMVDLAGSERINQTGSTGQRQVEATKINLSLSTLCHVISSLTDPKATYIPYRDSKLTRILQDSLGGNTKTVMIAAVGPGDVNYDQTINTLRYASKAKNIQNKPKINEDPKDALLREYQEEV